MQIKGVLGNEFQNSIWKRLQMARFLVNYSNKKSVLIGKLDSYLDLTIREVLYSVLLKSRELSYQIISYFE